jgi:hypothetical protein
MKKICLGKSGCYWLAGKKWRLPRVDVFGKMFVKVDIFVMA